MQHETQIIAVRPYERCNVQAVQAYLYTPLPADFGRKVELYTAAAYELTRRSRL